MNKKWRQLVHLDKAHRSLHDFYIMLSETQRSNNPFTQEELARSKAKGLPVPDAMILTAPTERRDGDE